MLGSVVYVRGVFRAYVPTDGKWYLQKLEIAEIKNGFVPDEDTAAYRVRRRYRLVHGGNPQLNLIHYSRGQPLRTSPVTPCAPRT